MAKNNKFKKNLFLTTMALAATHIANQAIFLSAEKSNLFVSKSTYKWKHGDIAYSVCGNGSPLLLIHNMSVESSQEEWSEIIGKLSPHYTVYTLDLLGCGNSQKPNITYTSYVYVSLINDFIIDIIGAQCDVVTSGFSSSFVTMAANMNSSLYNKLIFINPCSVDAATKQPENLNKLMKKLISTPIIGTLIYNLRFSRNNIRIDYTENKFSYTPAKISGYIDNCYINAHIGGSSVKALYASYSNNYFFTNYDLGLSKLEQDVLILTGSEFVNSELIVSNYLCKGSQFSHKQIGRTKALPHYERPTETSNEILDFLD